jgi:hypothetical protein
MRINSPTYQGNFKETEGFVENFSYCSQVTVWVTSTTTASSTATTAMPTAPATLTVTAGLVLQALALAGDFRADLLQDTDLILPLLLSSYFVFSCVIVELYGN